MMGSGLVRIYWFILNLIPSVAEPSVRVAHANRVHCARTRSCIATQGRICILLQFTQYHPLLAAGKSVVGSQTHSGAVEKNGNAGWIRAVNLTWTDPGFLRISHFSSLPYCPPCF